MSSKERKKRGMAEGGGSERIVEVELGRSGRRAVVFFYFYVFFFFYPARVWQCFLEERREAKGQVQRASEETKEERRKHRTRIGTRTEHGQSKQGGSKLGQ
jgi:hypothetical protein